MFGDYSRNSFNPRKHYSRVLLQQGRPLTDADWNEEVSIAAEREWNLIRSLLRGNHGTFDGGFLLQATASDNRLWVCPGSYYVHGLRCYLPFKDKAVDISSRVRAFLDSNKMQTECTLYLEAWEQSVTAIEERSILEPTLGGNDTSLRARIHWVIRAAFPMDTGVVGGNGGGAAHDDGTGPTPLAADDAEPPTCRIDCIPDETVTSCELHGSRPTADEKVIYVRRQLPSSDPNGVCAIGSPLTGVTEEVLYRVEVHKSGFPYQLTPGELRPAKLDDFMTFKWSRENGSNVVGIREPNPAAVVTVESGMPMTHWKPEDGNIVELFDGQGRAANKLRNLVSISGINQSKMTLMPALVPATEDVLSVVSSSNRFVAPPPKPPAMASRYFLRRWDQKGGTLSSDKAKPPVVMPSYEVKDVIRQSQQHKLTLTEDNVALAVVGWAKATAAEPDEEVMWLELEQGIQIAFKTGTEYSEGDYWLIRSTADSEDGFWPPVEHPQQKVKAKSLKNARQVSLAGGHVRAPLATITRDLKIQGYCWNGKTMNSCQPLVDMTPRPDDGPGIVQAADPKDVRRPDRTREAILTDVGRVAFSRFVASPEGLTRRVPARYLNYTPLSPAYTRYRSALLVSEILESSFDKYFSKVDRCLSLNESERAAVEEDARADYALALDFERMLVPDDGSRPRIA